MLLAANSDDTAAMMPGWSVWRTSTTSPCGSCRGEGGAGRGAREEWAAGGRAGRRLAAAGAASAWSVPLPAPPTASRRPNRRRRRSSSRLTSMARSTSKLPMRVMKGVPLLTVPATVMRPLPATAGRELGRLRANGHLRAGVGRKGRRGGGEVGRGCGRKGRRSARRAASPPRAHRPELWPTHPPARRPPPGPLAHLDRVQHAGTVGGHHRLGDAQAAFLGQQISVDKVDLHVRGRMWRWGWGLSKARWRGQTREGRRERARRAEGAEGGEGGRVERARCPLPAHAGASPARRARRCRRPHAPSTW